MLQKIGAKIIWDSDLDNDLSLAVLKVRLRSFLPDTDPDSEN
jgi:hypothetical protein